MRLLIEGLACVRGGREIFAGLDAVVAAGETLEVTGPNGAGKSSLLRLIAGLLRPAAGRIALSGAGEPPGTSAHFVGHLDGVKLAVTGRENLVFLRALLGGETAIDDALARLGLATVADLPVRMYSAGQRRRLALARLVLAQRALWLLDEPLTALDAEGQETFRAIANRHLAGGGLIVAATHAPLGVAYSRTLRLNGAHA
jgi:heme exporter protein A